MREIKFRAWDGKKMLTEDNCPYSMGYYDDIDIKKLHYFLNSSGFVWMQYTGLKDKNGREIYEGDILIETTDNPHGWANGWKPTSFVFPTYDKFSGGGMDTSVWGIGYCFDDLHPPMDSCEIIGNIYENPELLTVCL